MNQQLIKGGGGHGTQEGFGIGLFEVMQKQGRRDQVIAAGEGCSDGIGLEEVGLDALTLGRCAGEGNGFTAEVTTMHLEIQALAPAQATDGPHRVAATAGHIEDAQPPRRIKPCQATDGGGKAAGSAGQPVDPREAKQGRLVVAWIQARLIHHLGPQLPLGQLTPQDR